MTKFISGNAVGTGKVYIKNTFCAYQACATDASLNASMNLNSLLSKHLF